MGKNNYFKLKFWVVLSTLLVIFSISTVIILIFVRGFSAISFEFISSSPDGFPLGTEGGILPAIIGSLYFTGIATIFASVLALATAIYLNFYSSNAKITALIKIVVQSIAGIPSIVLGLFSYTFLVVQLDLGVSLLAGGLTLGIMIFPFIEVRLEKIFAEIDSAVVNSSYSLGVSKSYTLMNLVLPSCFNEILSTISLAAGFAMGAAAPILFTGGVIHAPIRTDITRPAMALPYHLYILVAEGISIENAYGTAFVLLSLLFIINGFAIFITYLRGRD